MTYLLRRRHHRHERTTTPHDTPKNFNVPASIASLYAECCGLELRANQQVWMLLVTMHGDGD